MKSTFTFDLPEEKRDFEVFSKSEELLSFINEILKDLRSIYKYDAKNEFDITPEEAGKFRNLLYENLAFKNLNNLID